MDNQNWEFIVALGIISFSLIASTFFRVHIRFIQQWQIPHGLFAGMLVFIFGNECFGFFHLDSEKLGSLIYHLLPLTFISMGLRRHEKSSGNQAFISGLILTLGYGIQVLLGMIFVGAMIFILHQPIFPSFGHFLALGFGQGPGQAYTLGKSWELLGLQNAGQIGLTFAAMGYLWSAIPGVLLVWWKKRKSGDTFHSGGNGLIPTGVAPEAGKQTTDPSAIDSLSYHLAWVFICYFLTYILLIILEKSLIAASTFLSIPSPQFMQLLMSTMWGIHFIFASMVTNVVNKTIRKTYVNQTLDDGLLDRLTGLGLDLMVTVAIGTISLSAFNEHGMLIILLSSTGGIITLFYCLWSCTRYTNNFQTERGHSMFGTLTGTLSTGLTLLRMSDPHLRTPVAQDLLWACGISTPISAPIIMSFLPLIANRDSSAFPVIFAAVFLALVVYMLFIFLWLKARATEEVNKIS